MNDLRVLHRSVDDRMFKMGCGLFVEEWAPREGDVVKKIQGSFFRKNNLWFGNSFVRVPKTNNALESINGNMTKYQLYDQKKPLKQFLKIALKVVRQRSKSYQIEKGEFQLEVLIEDDLMKKGYDYKEGKLQGGNYIYRANEEEGITDFFVFSSSVESVQKITL